MPLMTCPSLVSTTHCMYWCAPARVGYRIDSSRFARLALEPMTDNSGPTAPPTLLIVWHLRQAASFLRVFSSTSSPRAALPLRLSSAWMLGSFLGSSLGGAGSVLSASFLTSLKGLLRKRRA